MSVFDRLSVAAAEATMRTAGPRAGLRALRAIVDRVAGQERARAILAGLDCATALGDRRGLDEMIARWRVQSGDYFEAISARCLALRSVSPPDALALAEVESARCPDDARAHYLLGRLRGPEGDGDLRRALRLAQRPPAQASLVQAIHERLAWLGYAPAGFDTGEQEGRARLGKARADLRRGGRYARVAALDVLIELATGPLKVQALAVGAAHAERARVTTIEFDRLRTLLRTHLPAERRAAALGWLDIRAALDAGEAPPAGVLPNIHDQARAARAALEQTVPIEGPFLDGAATEDRVRNSALAVISAARGGKNELQEAAEAFAALGGEIPAAAEPYLVASALVARANADLGHTLADRLFSLPPQARGGWVRLGRALRDPERRLSAFERGVAIAEPGAKQALGETCRDRGWRAFRAGDSVTAARHLRRARALLR